jgi:nicotinamidase-related amidase
MQPHRNTDLHGNAPDSCSVALLLLDVVNDLEFDGGAGMLPRAIRMGRRIAALKAQASAAGVPVVYVNDNFGRWRSDFRRIVAHCLDDDVRGEPVVAMLVPDEKDYFVLKPKHSGFFNTTLDLLLDYLQVKTLVITGMATDACVLFTAADAYMRDLHVIIPRDCVTALTVPAHREALTHMRRVLKADIVSSRDVDFAELRHPRRSQRKRATAKSGTKR